MGESDDSPSAAQGARDTDQHQDQPDDENGGEGGFFRRFFGFGGTEEEDGGDAPQSLRDPNNLPGLANLRRMRVEDVSIPKADIIAVPDTITRDDLVLREPRPLIRQRPCPATTPIHTTSRRPTPCTNPRTAGDTSA